MKFRGFFWLRLILTLLIIGGLVVACVVLSSLEETGSWRNLEPRTPFKGYQKKPNRF
jgi:hypothetical protein